MRFAYLLALTSIACTGCGAPSTSSMSSSIENASTAAESSKGEEMIPGSQVRFRADVWADNWFALYVNGEKVGEDSVPITTERSFNAESFEFTSTYPMTIGLEVKDYTENVSGLEYIGTDRQQVGDGGVMGQVVDLDRGTVVAVTNSSWRSYVVQSSPLNIECVTSIDPLQDCTSRETPIPNGWAATSFDDSSWTAASEFSAVDVDPKDGFNDITWDSASRFIWGADLKIDNVVLLRLGRVSSP
jgi:hypothetical protein